MNDFHLKVPWYKPADIAQSVKHLHGFYQQHKKCTDPILILCFHLNNYWCMEVCGSNWTTQSEVQMTGSSPARPNPWVPSPVPDLSHNTIHFGSRKANANNWSQLKVVCNTIYVFTFHSFAIKSDLNIFIYIFIYIFSPFPLKRVSVLLILNANGWIKFCGI